MLNTVLAPDHFVDHTYVGLDDADYLGGDILIHIVGNGNAGFVVLDELYGYIHTLQEALGVNATQYKAALIQSFRALGAGADAHGRERMANTGEEAALLRQSAAVAHHGKGIHLEAVVVVKTKGLVLDDAFIQLEATGLQALLASGVAAVEDGHFIFLSHLIDSCKESHKILFCINVLFSMCT